MHDNEGINKKKNAAYGRKSNEDHVERVGQIPSKDEPTWRTTKIPIQLSDTNNKNDNPQKYPRLETTMVIIVHHI